MTQSVPWSVKGIDRKARETAKDLARRSGLTLGEWLNQMIEDQHDDDYVPTAHGLGGGSSQLAEAIERLSARIEAAETRSTLAITGIDQSVRGLVARIEETERNQTAVVARFEGVGQDIVGAQTRLTDRLRRLEDEAAGPRSLEALRAMEGTVAKLAGRITEVEGGVQEALTGARKDAEELSARMENAETGAVGMIDAVVGGIAERMKNAEAGTTLALRGLEASLAKLDKRLSDAEAKAETPAAPAGVGEEKLEALAAKLTSRVEAVRQEMAAKLHASADGRIDRLDRSMSDMTRHVQEAERRSAQAMERMGHEVLRMADSLGRRVSTVETRTAEAVEQMGGEVARIADQLDSRFHRADNAQAMALEKLGSEIARITERLSERIANAERRSAQAIDDVGEQVSRVTERLNQRQDRSAGDLAERIRQSEERTAKLLEEARERIDQRLDVQRRHPEPEPEPAPAPRAEPIGFSPFAEAALAQPKIFADASPFGPEPYSVESFIPAKPKVEPEPPAVQVSQGPFGSAISFAPADFEAVEPDAPSAFETAELTEPSFDEPHFGELRFDGADLDALDPFSAAPQTEADFAEPEAVAPIVDDFAPLAPEAEADTFEPQDDFLSPPPPIDNPGRPLSTRELIEQARARAREQASDKSDKARKPERGIPGLSFRSKKRANGKLKTGLLMGAAALCLVVVGYGWVQLLTGYDGESKPAIGPSQANAADVSPAAAAPGDPTDMQPRVAVAFDPQPMEDAAKSPSGQILPVAGATTPGPNPVALFNEAMGKVQAKDPSGLESLRKAANLGYAPAQMQLGRLYESGLLGLPEDMKEARRWTQRAAEGGYPKAMYNLGLYMFNGEGGDKDLTQAAQWFRRSADLGLSDGQYNLGVMYQKGYGVSKNPAEAYKWFMIASRNGDAAAKAQAKAMADQVRGQISADAQAAADRSAGIYTANAPSAAPVQLAEVGSEMIIAQRALNKLGYYQGSMDGSSSPATRQAIQSFQRDRGLPTTGALDPDTTQKLAPYAR